MFNPNKNEPNEKDNDDEIRQKVETILNESKWGQKSDEAHFKQRATYMHQKDNQPSDWLN